MLQESEPQIETVTPIDQSIAGATPPSHQTSVPTNAPDPVLKDPIARKILRAPSLRHLRRFAVAAVRVEPVETISPLLEMLSRPDGPLDEHESVIWMLCQIPLTESQRRDTVTALLQRSGLREKSCWVKLLRPVMVFASAILAVLLIPNVMNELAPLLFDSQQSYVVAQAIIILCVPLVVVAGLIVSYYRSNRVRLAVITALAQYPELRSLPAVTKSAFGVGNLQARTAAATICTILKTAASREYAGCTPMVMQAFNRLLDHPNDLLRIEVLKALEKVGDRSSITAVTRLARASMMPSVRTTAAHTLKALQGRARDEHESATLLRTATVPEEDGLLTPASHLTSSGAGEADDLLTPAPYLTSNSSGADTATRNGL